jgi:hypothetical protein
LGRFTEPYWVGEATHLQLEVDGADFSSVRAHVIDSLGHSRSLFERVSGAASAVTFGRPRPVEASPLRPPIVTRAEWGANESWMVWSPSAAPTIDFAVVHHTAGGNAYTQAQAPGVVRGIYHYHAVTLGWGDIGYNFLVDRFATIYEGRAGGVERAIIGGHARNFNTGSVGVSLMGNFDTMATNTTAVAAIANVIRWKFELHGVDPSARPNDGRVPTRIVGHRDVGQTTCPGRYLYADLPTIRNQVQQRQSQSEITSDQPPADAVRLTGDWNADGVDTPGWFKDGQWTLMDRDGTITRLTYGRAGDLPVVGDWNGDGRDTAGVARPVDGNLVFLLRRTYVSGDDVRMTYGRVGDIPVTGDWNGDGVDTLGVVRGSDWLLRYRYVSRADIKLKFGAVGDIPVTGDWNGDGTDTIGVVRDATWFLRDRFTGGSESQMVYGSPTDQPVAGDWNGNARDTIGVVRDARWILRNRYHRPFEDLVYTW